MSEYFYTKVFCAVLFFLLGYAVCWYRIEEKIRKGLRDIRDMEHPRESGQ